jgi:hypothetical protein
MSNENEGNENEGVNPVAERQGVILPGNLRQILRQIVDMYLKDPADERLKELMEHAKQRLDEEPDPDPGSDLDIDP